MPFQSFPHLTGSVFEAHTDQKQRLGTRICGVYGDTFDKYAELVYIKAGAALTKDHLYEMPLISGTDAFIVDAGMTTTLATAGAVGDSIPCCVPAVTLASGQYGWAFVKGHISIATNAAAAINVRLFTTATAGKVDDDASTKGLIPGFQLVVAAGSATTVLGYALHDLRTEEIA